MKLYTSHIAWHVEIHQNSPDLPYLIMLHGFMGTGEAFTPMVGGLSRFCNPVTADLIGHGRSGGSSDPERYQIAALIEDLKSILSRLQLSPLFLYGYSMGGRLALQFALHQQKLLQQKLKNKRPVRDPGEDPESIDGLILESTTFGINSEKERGERRQLDDERASALRSDFFGFLQQWNGNPLFTGSRRRDSEEQRSEPEAGAETEANVEPEASTETEQEPEIKPDSDSRRKQYKEWMQNQNPEWLAACLRGFSSGAMPSSAGQLKSLSIPVLLISGENDSKFTSIHQQMAAEIPDATFRVMTGAAHRVHLDQPARLLKEIEHFINQKSS